MFDATEDIQLDFAPLAERLRGQVTWESLGETGLRAASEFYGCAAWTQGGRRRKLAKLQAYLERDDEVWRGWSAVSALLRASDCTSQQ